MIFAFPTNDHLYAVFVAWPIAELDRVRANIERELLAVVDGVPEFAAACARDGERSGSTARRASRTSCASRTARAGRSSATPAATRIRTGRSASATPSATPSFSPTPSATRCPGASPEEDALARYERRRNEATLPDYRQNIEQAKLQPAPDEFLALRARLRGDDEATKRFYLASEGLLEAA